MALAVLISAALAYALGWLWYSPKLFGATWKEAIGRKDGPPQENIAKHAVSFAGWVVAAFVYAFLLSAGHSIFHGIKNYLCLSVALWGGFMMPPKAMAIMYGNFNTRLLWIDGGYNLAGYAIFALVFHLFT